jgi:hypothetical protein
MKVKLFIISILCQLSQASFACESFFGSEKLKLIMTGIQNSKEIWEGYSPVTNPVVLTDLPTSPKCIAIYTGNNWIFETLMSPLIISNTVYDFYPYSDENPELKTKLLDMGISRATVMSLHNFMGDLIANFPGGESGLFFMVLMHESFHLFYDLGSPLWPSWIRSVEGDRDEVLASCYNTNKKNLHLELRELLESFKQEGNSPEFKRSIKNFISLRSFRYLAFPECREMESSWEMTEGIAEYVGWKLGLEVLITKTDLLNYFESEFTRSENNLETEYFYLLGALQLFAIDKIDKNILIQRNPLMGSNRTVDDSIFELLKKIVINDYKFFNDLKIKSY